MRITFKSWVILLALTYACSSTSSTTASQTPTTASTVPPSFAVLVFSKTAGFRHDSIGPGIFAIQALGRQKGFSVDATEDASRFNDATLSKYKAVVFLCTTGDVRDTVQQAVFERFIRAGGGYAGIHSAADTEYDWPFYGALLGAYFNGHPDIQQATLQVESSPITSGLPRVWTRRDEWYNFQVNPRGRVDVLATIDEHSYTGGTMGADHPVMWSHAFEGGRGWYTAGGHTSESFSEPLFLDHLAKGILWVAGAL